MKIDPREELFNRGVILIDKFCHVNKLPRLSTSVVQSTRVGACAYYRDNSITISIKDCARPCGETNSRQWSYPGYVVDRTPYGVLAHELGHHVDWNSDFGRQYRYSSDYCLHVQKESGEAAITSYCPNPAEWFAEIFRLFVTNPDLLRRCRPKAYNILVTKWSPIEKRSWDEVLNSAPERVLTAAKNKMKIKP